MSPQFPNKNISVEYANGPKLQKRFVMAFKMLKTTCTNKDFGAPYKLTEFAIKGVFSIKLKSPRIRRVMVIKSL